MLQNVTVFKELTAKKCYIFIQLSPLPVVQRKYDRICHGCRGIMPIKSGFWPLLLVLVTGKKPI